MHRGSPARATPDVTHGTDVRHGKAVYEAQCLACHGADGSGGPVGPSLRNEHAHRSFESVRSLVSDPQPPMPKLFPSRLTEQDVRDVSGYVETL
ncbi:MAG TPA: cytochrome c [Candidatus Baltobacteraceae bacterium]|nr:cytochrome c [Candidatus Baltobacteraceae bacterium]